MNLDEAIKLLGITNIENITTDELKRIWRGKMKETHPDLVHGNKELSKIFEKRSKQLNNALETVETILSAIKLQSNTSELTIITLEELIQIYKGQTVKARFIYDFKEQTKEIDKYNLRKEKVFVQITCRFVVEGIETEKRIFTPVVIGDRYSLDIAISSTNMCEELPIRVGLLEKELNVNLKIGRILKINFNPEKLVHIAVQLERVIKNDESEKPRQTNT